jgi:transposase
MTGSGAGSARASGSGCCKRCSGTLIRRASCSGRWCRWTAPSCGPTSTLPGLATPSLARTTTRAEKKGAVEASDEALGRSRGGFSTKLHLAFEGRGRPLAVRLTAGQRHESTQLAAVLDSIRVPRPQGRPRQRPAMMALDKGYSYPKCRQLLRQRGIRHVIPERKDQKARRQAKGKAGGRPPLFDREIYRLRSWAERGVNRLKQFRRIATRYEKRAANYLGFVHLACIMIWLRA